MMVFMSLVLVLIGQFCRDVRLIKTSLTNNSLSKDCLHSPDHAKQIRNILVVNWTQNIGNIILYICISWLRKQISIEEISAQCTWYLHNFLWDQISFLPHTSSPPSGGNWLHLKKYVISKLPSTSVSEVSPSVKPFIWKLVLFTCKFWFIYMWMKLISIRKALH